MVARFHKLIIKTSVSPLLLAKGNFTDLIDNEFVEFEPGKPVMSRKGIETVDRFSAFLAANPNTGLLLSGYYDHSVDAAAMKTAMETVESERVAAENKSSLEKWQAQKKAYTKLFEQKKEASLSEGKIAEQDIPDKFLQEFIPALPQQVTVDKSMLEDLADKRVGIVYLYFTDQLTIEQKRVTIVESEQLLPAGDELSTNVSIRIRSLK